MIRFESEAGAPVTMAEELALRFIRMSGHHETVPGAIAAEDVPQALARLRQAVATAQASPEDERQDEQQDDDERPVSLSTRAFPLVQLLEATARKKKDVLWRRFDGVYV